ncbi:sigma-70 family RNA polymerase sigma factor [Marinobacter sp. HL-58]|uniref:sigma-70 family RNA polymerase sigma factor n=1 Tax=Marinobacter sp. HL-58 TaxID=1479237 RepID=UPI0006DAC9D3|nr:sigma-70 family RNA polymerase sigma factor [Marinobacter sp. HL-58]KPP97987.1 MAG: RNA polymerase sigma-70 factor, ECF subfamily [Marinobacter sp. HL-58]
MTASNRRRETLAVSKQRRDQFEQEVTRLMDRLYGTALRLARNPDDAEDVVAETVSNAWKKLDQLENPAHMEGWLFRILHHTFVSHWRRRQCRQAQEVDIEPEESGVRFSLFEKLHQPFLLWWGAPEREFVNALLQEDIRRAIDNLPDCFRLVIVLVEIEGYSYEEVSRLLDLPLGTVRSRVSRARGLLQKALWNQGREAGLAKCCNPAAGTSSGGDV